MESKQVIRKTDIVVLKWIMNICRQQIPTVIFLVLVNIVHGVTSVIFANFSKHVIDGATINKDMAYIVKYSVALLGVVLLQMLLSVIRSCVAERCKGRLDMTLRSHMLDSIMKKDYSMITSYHTGELHNRMFNDISVVSDNFTKIVPNIAFFISKLSGALIYLVILDKIFALIFLVAGILIFTITRLFRSNLKSLHKNVQETEGRTRSYIQEAISNLLAVKAFAVENKIEEQADELQKDNFKAIIKKRNFSIIANVGLSTIFNIGSVFAIAFGAWRILTGVMTYGTVTAMIQLVNQVQAPFASLSGIFPQYYSMIASAERLIEIDELEDEIAVNDNDFNAKATYKDLKSIRFDNISFKYDRDIILDQTSLTVNKGDFVAIMGISGIGKSTLLKLLLGVFSVYDGSIILNTDKGDIPVDKYTRKLFSYVPQGNMLISGTIKDNLTFINDNVTDEEIERAIDISCSRQFIDDLPDGIHTVIGEKGMGLSEGQVQRLAIARSILSKAPVLLFDEATSALDDATERQFLTQLKALDNVTCIIISHKKAALEICNKHIQIMNGKIVEG